MFRISGNRIAALTGVVLGMCGVLVAGGANAGLTDKTLFADATENNYIRFTLGTDGAWLPKSAPPHAWDTILPMSGRFEIFRTGGNPLTPDDNQTQILERHPMANGPADRMNVWAIQVDDGKGAWVSFASGGITGLLGDEKNGWWTISPYTPDNRPLLRATIDPVKTAIHVDLETRVLHDAVKFKWKFTNTGNEATPTAHYVGVKLITDPFDGTTTFSGATPGGNPDVHIDGQPVLSAETLLSGSDIPDKLEFFDRVGTAIKTGRYTFRGDGATPPDKVGIDDWGIISSEVWAYPTPAMPDLWTYEPISHYPLANDDLAIGAIWKPRLLAPGQSFEIITYIGCADADTKFALPSEADPQYIASVHGPRTLAYDDTSGIAVPLSPNPFTIGAYIDSQLMKLDLTNVSFTLNLPKGLVLDPTETGGLTKTVAQVSPLGSTGVTWKVRPDGTVTGKTTYSVSFSASPVGGTSINREINIPGTIKTYLQQKWQMIASPFKTVANLNAPPPSPGSSDAPADLSALGIPGAYGTDWRLWAYDSHTNTYFQPDHITPGTGYWLWARDANLTTSADPRWLYEPVQWAGTMGQQMPLERGWNLVGNPFIYGITLGECLFFHPTYGTLTYDEAMAKNLVSKTVYWYDTRFRDYRWSSDRSVELKPWMGYWLKALQPNVRILITPESQVGASLTTTGTGGTPPPPAP